MYFCIQIHWFSIFNSFMMVIFLVGLVSMILMRTLRKDYARYSKDDDLDDMVSNLLYFSVFYSEVGDCLTWVITLSTAWSFQVLSTCCSPMTKECNWQIINMSVMPFCHWLAACTLHLCAQRSWMLSGCVCSNQCCLVCNLEVCDFLWCNLSLNSERKNKTN